MHMFRTRISEELKKLMCYYCVGDYYMTHQLGYINFDPHVVVCFTSIDLSVYLMTGVTGGELRVRVRHTRQATMT